MRGYSIYVPAGVCDNRKNSEGFDGDLASEARVQIQGMKDVRKGDKLYIQLRTEATPVVCTELG